MKEKHVMNRMTFTSIMLAIMASVFAAQRELLGAH